MAKQIGPVPYRRGSPRVVSDRATAPPRQLETGRKRRGRIAPPSGSIDLFGASAAPGADLLAPAAAICRCPVAAEREGRLELELALEARPPFLPAFLVLELVLVQRGGLLDAVRRAELDRELGGLTTHLVPRRAQRELIGDRADAACVNVARKRDRGDDRPRPEGRLRVQRHGQDVEVVA